MSALEWGGVGHVGDGRADPGRQEKGCQGERGCTRLPCTGDCVGHASLGGFGV